MVLAKLVNVKNPRRNQTEKELTQRYHGEANKEWGQMWELETGESNQKAKQGRRK